MSIESSVVDFLRDRLTVPVAEEVPHGPLPSYVVVERTGGGDGKDGLRRAILAIRAVAPTLEQAVGISVQVRSAMRLLPVLPRVFRCECTREYNFTDTRSKERRYQAVFEILYMEE